MANKKYSDFTSELPSPSRIWLHADPATGEPKKATMNQLTGCLFANSILVNANNSGADPQNLATITIPAAMFDAVGSWVESVFIGETLDSTPAPVVRTIINSTDPAPMTLSANGLFRLETWIQRISSTQLKCTIFGTRVLTNTIVASITTISLAQGADLTIITRLTNGAADAVFSLGCNGRAYSI